MWKKKIVTIPNILTAFRIVLAFSYLVVFMTWEDGGKRGILAGILVISAVTDFLDGRIARKYNMVSELGKLLDPVADKLTQGILLLCLLMRYRVAKYVLLLFVLKESYMVVMGLKTIKDTGRNDGAMWYGKVSTAVFYTVMILLELFPGIPHHVGECMLIGCGGFMLLAFAMYGLRFHKLQKNAKETVTMDSKREAVL